MKFLRTEEHVLTPQSAHFISLAESFIVQFSKLLKSASKIKKKASQARETTWTFDKRAPGEKTVLLASILWGL